jgi:hypothetical protein
VAAAAVGTILACYACCGCQAGDRELWRFLPEVLLLHGTADRSIPCQITLDFAKALKVGSSLSVHSSSPVVPVARKNGLHLDRNPQP